MKLNGLILEQGLVCGGAGMYVPDKSCASPRDSLFRVLTYRSIPLGGGEGWVGGWRGG